MSESMNHPQNGSSDSSKDSPSTLHQSTSQFLAPIRNGWHALSLTSVMALILAIGVVMLIVVQPFHGGSSLAKANVTPQEVGTATTFASGSSGSPRTAFPSGTVAGDVEVSMVETYPFATITCPTAWTMAFDVVSSNTTRLAACVGVVTTTTTAPTAKILPPTQVSMVTASFSGVSTSSPIAGETSAVGLLAPAITAPSGDLLVLGEGSEAWTVVAKAPASSSLGATTNDNGDSQSALAFLGAPATGSWQGSWSVTPYATAAVSGALALTPASGVTTTTAAPTTTTAAPTTTTTAPTTTTTTTPPSGVTTPPSGVAPSTPTAQVCGNTSYLNGPATAPAGSVTLNPTQNPSTVVAADAAGTTFWFSPGTYTLGTGEFNQIIPKTNDTFIGAPGAVLNGQNLNDFAFTQTATGVTVSYLTIENFGQTGGNNNQGVVNHDSGTSWTIAHNTIENNAGAGVMLGNNDVLSDNCLTENGQYGFNAYLPNGVSNITLTGNEISNNDTYNWEVASPGCGCAGGGKFWHVDGATVTGNYVHGNQDVGLWADTNNTGFNISENYISNNYSVGIMYEISYNAMIADNTLVGNAIGSGPANPGFPEGAIYVSESGGDTNVAPATSGYTGQAFDITGNVFTNNWSGVVLWENADRFCGGAGAASTVCTLDNPTTYYSNPGLVTAAESGYGGGDAVVNGTTSVTSAQGFTGVYYPYTVTAPTVGEEVIGTDIPAGDTIASVTSANAITLTKPATGSATKLTLWAGAPGGCGPYDLAGSVAGASSGSPSANYNSNCRWKTQNVSVTYNTFNFSPSAIGSSCTAAHSCGLQGLFSNYGTYPTWSPYAKSTIEAAISSTQHNSFSNNTYNGPWEFMVHDQGQVDSFATWQSTWSQDAGSTDNP
jgi:Right handed beta helix region